MIVKELKKVQFILYSLEWINFSDILLISEAGSNNQTVCSGSAIAAIIYQFPDTANASVTDLPAGVTSHWDRTGNTLTISGTPAASGTFTYTVTADGSSTVGRKITITPNFTQANPAAATICYNATHTFTVAAATGGSGTLSYQWQSSTNNSTWSNITNATSANYTTPVLTASTYYRRQATRTTCGSTITSTSALVTVTSNFTQANPAAATIGSNTTHTFTVAAATGGSGTLSYQWQSSTNNSTWSNITNATSANYTTPNLTANTYYRRQATRTTCGGTINSASALVTVINCPGLFIPGGAWTVSSAASLPADATAMSSSSTEAKSITATLGQFTKSGQVLCYYYRDFSGIANTNNSNTTLWTSATNNGTNMSYVCGASDGRGVDAVHASSSWRLPNIAELAQIGQLVSNGSQGTSNTVLITQSMVNDHISAASTNGQLPAGSTVVSATMYNLRQDRYWSSTSYGGDSAERAWGWYYNQTYRSAFFNTKTTQGGMFYIRCVRSQ
jgi:hypothetical protein